VRTHTHTRTQAGLITGGSAGNLEDRARRWDEKAVDELKAQREELAKRLSVSMPCCMVAPDCIPKATLAAFC